MAIKGSLKEASLADVFQLLALGGKTGCLSVTDRSNFGQIYFDRGRVTYARIVNRRDRLGDLLVRHRVLTQTQLQRVVDDQTHHPQQRLGDLLVAEGMITREQLEQYIAMQIEEAVYFLFTWNRGSFFFESDREPEDADILVSLNPEGLLLEGARRVDEWSLVEKKVPSLDLVFQLDPDRILSSGVELTDEQQQILSLVDGQHSLQQIAERTGIAEFEVGKAVYGLLQAGFAHQVGRRRPTATSRSREAEVDEHRNLGVAFYRSGMLGEARREFERVLELTGEDASARFHLALIALREERPIDAVRRLKEVVEVFGSGVAPFQAMAVALVRLGRGSEALLALKQADAAGGAAAATLLRASVLLGRGEDGADEALDAYRETVEGGETSALYHHLVALSSALRRDLSSAREALDEGLEAHPTSAPLLCLAGVVAEREGDLERAERLQRRAAEEDPTLPQPHKNLGDIAYRRGLHDDALDHFKRATQLDPDLGDDVYTKLGNIHYKRMEREHAVRCWSRALELNPANPVVRKNLAVAGHAV